MKRLSVLHARAFLWGLLALAGLAWGRPAAAEVRVRMVASGTEVSVASNFQVTVVVEGISSQIDFPNLGGEGFQVVNRSSGQSSRITLVNGRRQAQTSITFTYLLRPLRAGTIHIPPVGVEIEGVTYRSPAGLTIEVQPIQPQDHLILELHGPPEGAVYVDQEFMVTLKVFVRRLGGQYRDADPFPREGWPRLSIPWFEGQEGFSSEEFQKFAERLIDPSGNSGFPVNRYARREFFSEVPYRFKLRRSESKRTAGDGREYLYFVYTLEKKFRPEKPGKSLFGGVLARGHVGTEQGGQVRLVEVLAQSEPLWITVKTPPEEGRPPFFTGGIGRFEVSAAVKPPRVWVGEPLTLTVSVKGNGPLENVGPPPLAAQEGFQALFRIHDEPKTGVTDPQNRLKTFTYGIRAKSAEVKAIPPIQLAFFDPDQEKYVTVKTEPLPIQVEEGKSTGGEFFDAARRDGTRSEVQVVEPKLYQIYEEPDALKPAVPPLRFGPLHAAVLTSPPLLSLCILALVVRHRRLRADPAGLRARRAYRRAAESLREAQSALRSGQRQEVHAALARAVARLVGDRLSISSAGITAGDAGEALRLAEVEPDLVEEARAVFERADRARYGVEEDSPEGLGERIRETRALLGKLEARLRSVGRGRR